MARKIKTKQTGFGICHDNPDGTTAWIVGDDRDVLLFATPEEAARAFAKMKKNTHYSWSIPHEVREFKGFDAEKKAR